MLTSNVLSTRNAIWVKAESQPSGRALPVPGDGRYSSQERDDLSNLGAQC